MHVKLKSSTRVIAGLRGRLTTLDTMIAEAIEARNHATGSLWLSIDKDVNDMKAKKAAVLDRLEGLLVEGNV